MLIKKMVKKKKKMVNWIYINKFNVFMLARGTEEKPKSFPPSSNLEQCLKIIAFLE